MADRLVVDCGTGDEQVVQLTAQEEQQRQAEADAGLAVLQQEQTARTNAATIRQQADQALATNRAYVALASPTAAQTTAEVKALARQQNGLIRLLLNKLDATD